MPDQLAPGSAADWLRRAHSDLSLASIALPQGVLVEVTSKATDSDAHNREVREAMDHFLREGFA